MIESAQLEVVRATADGLCQHAEAGLLYPLYIREINQEIAHALADQPGHGGGALAVDLAAQAEHEMAVLDRRKHLQHAPSVRKWPGPAQGAVRQSAHFSAPDDRAHREGAHVEAEDGEFRAIARVSGAGG